MWRLCVRRYENMCCQEGVCLPESSLNPSWSQDEKQAISQLIPSFSDRVLTEKSLWLSNSNPTLTDRPLRTVRGDEGLGNVCDIKRKYVAAPCAHHLSGNCTFLGWSVCCCACLGVHTKAKYLLGMFAVQLNILLSAKQRSALQFVSGRKHRYYNR